MPYTLTPTQYVGVFNEVKYTWIDPDRGLTFVNISANLAIQIAGANVNPNDFIVISGPNVRAEYKGTFRVLTKVFSYFDGPVPYYNLTLDALNIGNSPTGIWGMAGKKPFWIQTFKDGVWSNKDVVYVSANPVTLEYTFSVAGFLKKYFTLTSPVPGIDNNMWLHFRIRIVESGTDLNAITTTKYGYYGYLNPTADMITNRTPLGPLPIMYVDKAGVPLPVMFSEIDSTRALNNLLAVNPTDVITNPAVHLDLLAGGVYEITFQHTGVITSLNFSPALPSWITVLPSPTNQVKLRINTVGGSIGDYLEEDYYFEDYSLTILNSLVGCYAFSIRDGATEIFDWEFCVGEVEGQEVVCPDDSLSFAFLNDSGGYTTVIIPCKYTRGKSFGKDITAVRSNGNKFRAEVSDVYNTYEVVASVLSRRQLDYIEAMRTSIHVVMWDAAAKAFIIPIVINKENFTTYGNKFNATRGSAAFRFDVAKRVNVQTQ